MSDAKGSPEKEASIRAFWETQKLSKRGSDRETGCEFSPLDAFLMLEDAAVLLSNFATFLLDRETVSCVCADLFHELKTTDKKIYIYIKNSLQM